MSKRFPIGICLFVLVPCVVQSAEVSLVPVSSTGPYQLVAGNSIHVQPGSRVFLEFRISGWDPDLNNSPQLKTVQAAINLGSYANEFSPTPLFFPNVACNVDADCNAHFAGISGDSNTNCQPFLHCTPGSKCCSPIYSDISRPDWAAAGTSAVVAADIFSARIGFTTDGSAVGDSGSPKYVGTLVLDVPADAFGEFTIDFRSAETFVQSPSFPPNNHIPGTMNPAKVFVGIKPVSNYSVKPRYFTVDHPYNYGGLRAYRVTLTSLHRPVRPAPQTPHDPDAFAEFEGQTRWIGPPAFSLIENEDPARSFISSSLECAPYFGDWSGLPINVFGSEVMPDSIYRVEMLSSPCSDPNGSSCVVQDMGEFVTGRWADVSPPFERDLPGTQPDFNDIGAMVDRFRNSFGAPSKAQSQLQPNAPDPDGNFSFTDISNGIDAFRGMGYPYPGPIPCP